MDGDRDGRVRERAYALWEQEGRPEGRDLDHWHQACQEIDPGDDQETGSLPPPSSPQRASQDSASGPKRSPESRKGAEPEAAGSVGILQAADAEEAVSTGSPGRRQQS